MMGFGDRLQVWLVLKNSSEPSNMAPSTWTPKKRMQTEMPQHVTEESEHPEDCTTANLRARNFDEFHRWGPAPAHKHGFRGSTRGRSEVF